MRYPLACHTLHLPTGPIAPSEAYEVRLQDDDSVVPVFQYPIGTTELAAPVSDPIGHPEGFVDSGSLYFHSPFGRFEDQVFEAVTWRDQAGRFLDVGVVTATVGPTSGAAALAIPAGQLNFTKRPGVDVEVQITWQKLTNDNAGGKANLTLIEGANIITYGSFEAAVANEGFPGSSRRILPDDNLDLADGDHTWNLQLQRGVAGNATSYCDQWAPLITSVREC